MKPIPSTSAVDAVLTQLRDAILTGEMPPGDQLHIPTLQRRLGVSHIPIREALRQLESEGLIIAPPRRRPEVAGVAINELSTIYELRRLVEIPTARQAIAAATGKDRTRVRQAFKRLELAERDTGSKAFWDAHRELHRLLVTPAATVWTYRVLEPLWQASERYVRLFVTQYGSSARALSMHRSLAEAYESRDPEALASALSEHFTETERIVSDGYRQTVSARTRAASTPA